MRINIIGDSHAAALGPRLKQLLAADDVWFDSYPGFSTSRLLTALETQEEFDGMSLRPVDLTIVILGGNDFGNRDAERVNLLSYLAENNAGRILWVGPAHSTNPEVNLRHRDQVDAQREQLDLLHVDWVDSYRVTTANHAPDGVHFTPDGYDMWATHIAKAVHRRARIWATLAWSAIIGVVAGIFVKTLRLGKRR